MFIGSSTGNDTMPMVSVDEAQKPGAKIPGGCGGVTPPSLKYSGFRRAVEDLAGQRERIL